MKESAVPVTINKPSTIPAHWVDQVRKDIEHDIDLGVLERVPSNTPTTWCSRMHVVSKKSGEPRRVVDLRAVNSATARQTHTTEPPFRQATTVPPNTWRFSTDSWNGYHSIPLDTRDTHVMTFLTPWGRLRYLVTPQGSLSSGDGYTFWYDQIIRALKKLKKCVDDVLGWADTLWELFFSAMNFLYHTNSHGVTQNPAKFAWGRREIEFLGFWLSEDGVQPSQETLKSITDFPRPSDITGIRSWFGLIDKVAFKFSKNALMAPFRDLLSKNAVFAWNNSLQEAFDTAKKEIIKLVADGVKTFDTTRSTCIVTDWSKSGMGFALWQKHCQCTLNHPSCCKTGWKLITCGSRFCTPAESRYHPIEGELLALTWSLRKTSYYTLGCENLIALVDHKPLLGLLTTRDLGDIENPRPGQSKDLEQIRLTCITCTKNSPSQQPMPPVDPASPDYPFQLVSADYFTVEGHNYLVVVDCYSNWPIVMKCKNETAQELVTALREYFCTYGVPQQIASDGGTNFMAHTTKQFLDNWGVEHRVSSAHHPHSKLRTEAAVKTVKRLITDNTDKSGSLDNDAIAAALLTYRNTPDRDTQRSPSQILYARQMRDSLPCDPARLVLHKE